MKKQLLIVLLIAVSYLAKSQGEIHPFEVWGKEVGSQFMFHKSVTKTDGSGNVYVAGATMNAGTYDILLVKYNSSGVQQWIQQYNGYGNYHDFASAVFVDGSGNVYITGTVTDSLLVQGSDIITMKYNSSGTLQWATRYNGSGNYHDSGADIVVDGSGNVYITGGIHTSTSLPYTDAVIIKYNSSGTQQWATIYNNTTYNKSELGSRIRLTGTGKAIVSGAIQSASNTYVYGVLEYNTSTGAQIGGAALGSGSSDIQYFGDLVIDSNYNYYIAGASYDSVSTGYNYYVMKLDSTLAVQWEDTFDGGDALEDMANGIQVDGSGNVYVTGYSTQTGEGKNITTLKYNSSGSMQWNISYNDTLNGDDAAMAMTINASGEIYVTGYDSTYLGNYNYITIKYDASGTELWKIRYDGMSHQKDKATNICIDNDGDVIVTGLSETAPATYEYITLKYVEKNIITPTDAMGESPSTSFLYYANKGQLISTDSTFIPDLKYYTNNTYPNYYFKNDTMSMVFASIDTIPATDDTLHRIDMVFVNSNAAKKIYPMKEQSSYLNYFLGHCPDGVTGIHGNQQLVIPDLYSNIDLIYTSNQNGIKYYFVIKPGGRPKDIKFEYYGATSTYHDTGTEELSIISDIGSITFDQPFMYQIDSNNDTINGSSRLIGWTQDGTDSYLFSNYNPYDGNEILIIEVDQGNFLSCIPQVSFKNIFQATYYGGNNLDEVRSVKVDYAGGNYLYHVAGSTLSTNFPWITGTVNTAGNRQSFVGKLGAGGIAWTTLWGGSNSEELLEIDIKITTGKITTVGSTYSADFPVAHSGAQYWQPSGISGLQDGFITRLTNLGMIEWSTFFGGTGNESIGCVVIANNNLYVGGTGDNNSPHISKTGAYNSTTSPSGTKGIIARFNNQDSLVWSTFIGNEVMDIDYKNNKVVIAGDVKTNDLPIMYSSSQYIDSTLSGGKDAFFAIFNNSDTLTWSTYYGGSNGDVCNGVKFDNLGYIYATGESGTYGVSSNDFPTYFAGGSSYIDSVYKNNGDIVFWKFTNNGERLWASYYNRGSGSGANNPCIYEEFGKDLTFDANNNVYFCGTTRSHIEVFPGFYDPYLFSWSFNNTPNTFYHGFLISFSPSLERRWATIYGGMGQETGEAITYDQMQNTVILVGNTNTASNSFAMPVYYNPAFLFHKCENAGVLDNYIATFSVNSSLFTGIDELNNVSTSNNNILVYPNPSSSDITINFGLNSSVSYNIEIINTVGQLIFSKQGKSSQDFAVENINISSLSNGLYLVKIKIENQVISTKFIKN